MTQTLIDLFVPPKGCHGDFGFFCGFTATPRVLEQVRRSFAGEAPRPVLAAFIHPTTQPVSDIPGLAWMWMRLKQKGYNLLHAKVALLGFRKRGTDTYVIRLAVSTGNWTQDPLTTSIDIFWQTDLSTDKPNAQDIADIRAAWDMFAWLRERANTELIERAYDGMMPYERLKEAIEQLPEANCTARFIDSRTDALFEQVIERFDIGWKANRLVLGSGYFEAEGDGAAGLPERLRKALVERGVLVAEDASLDLFLNPASCQGLAMRAPALLDAGWNLRRAVSALHGEEGRLHAKFVLLGAGEKSAKGRVYIGSGNLSRNGFELSALRGGNLEAGVVVDLPEGLKWRNRKGSKHGLSALLPIHFRDTVELSSLEQGSAFVPPEEPDSLPPVACFFWEQGVLSAPGNGPYEVVLSDGSSAFTPCDWPAPAPAVVTLCDGGWRLPVLSEGVLVIPQATAMTVEDVLAGLGAFPEPTDGDNLDDMWTESAPLTIDVVEQEGASANYPIRRMMNLLVRLSETQAQVDVRDWERWCRELRQNLCAICGQEDEMIEFFRTANANPLPALCDPRMCPDGASLCLLEEALQTVAKSWSLGDAPSLWAE